MKLKQFSLIDDALRVRRAHGKGLLKQAVEILQAKRRNPTLGATDYFAYRLYDPDFLGNSKPDDFLGWRAQEDLPLSLNNRQAVTPAWDKFTFALFAHAFDLPVPRLIGLYKEGPAPVNGMAGATLGNLGQLADWLRSQGHWPLFAKPSYNQGGRGCYHLAGYRAVDDTLVTRSGEEIPVEHFVTQIVGHASGEYFQRDMGYLFQEVLSPHERIAELLGNSAISGVRLVQVLNPRGVETVTAFWKIVTGNNYIDNIHGFTTGNLTGDIDLLSGQLGRVLDGFGPRGSIVSVHPDTKRPFEGFVLPHWKEVVALCKTAGRLFPLIRMQCWDIAITDKGPILIELNDIPDIAVMQMWGRGILNTHMLAVLREHGASKFPWIKWTV